MTARERFKQICRFERPNDPYMWSIAAWGDTYKRWYDEGMPKTLNMKEIKVHLLGDQDRIESIQPRGAIQGMTRHGELRWIVALDPMFEPEVLSETEEHVVEVEIEWQAHLAYEMAKKVFASGVTLDWVWIWEDMAFNKGPLVSPAFVKRYMVPRYRKVVDLLRSHDVEALILDCDGNIDELLPIWIDCGINATYPLECAAGMDGRKVRKEYGNDVILIGNVDKRALARGKQEIDAEIDKVKSLLEWGGYFPNVDHHIPPDVPYENMVYFLNEVRKLSDYEYPRI